LLIDELLGDFPRDRFLREYFLKLPFAYRAGCTQLESLGNGDTLNRVASDPSADVIVSRLGDRWTGDLARPGQLEELLAAGYTIGIRHAEQHDGGLAALAVEFEQDFLSPVDVHLYCTPANQAGFGWHYDAEDVFVLQTSGSKEWSLRKNTVNPWPLLETLPQDMRYGREVMPLMKCLLAPGDWLYIPAGYWHCTHSREESISLSVGLHSATAIDLYDFVRPKLLESIRWRQRLPPICLGGENGSESPSGLTEMIQGLVEDLEAILTVPGLQERLCRARLTASDGGEDQIVSHPTSDGRLDRSAEVALPRLPIGSQ
jgi:50S ribosomal protein L16 3-hydroxylase